RTRVNTARSAPHDQNPPIERRPTDLRPLQYPEIPLPTSRPPPCGLEPYFEITLPPQCRPVRPVPAMGSDYVHHVDVEREESIRWPRSFCCRFPGRSLRFWLNWPWRKTRSMLSNHTSLITAFDRRVRKSPLLATIVR